MRALPPAILLLSFASALWGDIVVLKDGRKFEGSTTDRGDVLELTTEFGTLTFDKKSVEKVVKDVKELLKEADVGRGRAKELYEAACLLSDAKTRNGKLIEAVGLLQDAFEEYDQTRRSFPGRSYDYLDAELTGILQQIKLCRDKRVLESADKPKEEVYREKAATAGADAEAHFRLSAWCEAQGMRDLAKAELLRTIEIDTDHAAARERLGHVRDGDRWVTKEEKALRDAAAGAGPAEKPAGPSDRPPARPLKDLVADLQSDDDLTRSAAVAGLAALGSQSACDAVVARWRNEKRDSPVYVAIRDSLPMFKPRDVAAKLEKIADAKDLDEGFLPDCVVVLEKLGGTDCGTVVVKLYFSGRDEVKEAAAGALARLGDDAVPGLAKALASESRRGDAIRLLGEIKTEKSAAALAPLLASSHDRTPLGAAVNAALKNIGKPAVPALIGCLGNPRTKLWAGFLLREITGEQYTSGDRDKWIQWWKLHKGEK